jgi:murein L,D-transpeptidase YafK
MMKLPGIAASLLLFIINTSFHGKDFSQSSYRIVIDKSKYELSVYDLEGWLVTYPVVFGNKDLGDKLMEGDRKTPEGTYTIISKRMHQKWDRFIMLDYPTQRDYEKFNYRKQHGLIPPNARIGGGVGIHGVWRHEDYTIDQYQNWTEGCISMKNQDVEELFKTIPVGTKVTIER